MKLCPYHKDGLGWDACSEGFEGCEIKKARGEAKMKRIELPVGDIVIDLDGTGGGSITSSMHDQTDKDADGGLIGDYNAAIDGLESFILALACSGHYDLNFPPFAEAVATAEQAIGNQY